MGKHTTGQITKQERKASRAKLGNLSGRLVSERTTREYEKAIQAFFVWLQQSRQQLPSEVSEFDLVLCNYIDCCWQEGEARTIISYLLSGLHHFTPA